MKIVLILFLITVSYQQEAEVVIRESEYQWIQEGFWVDCETKEIILANNCESEFQQQECYLIPLNGLCSVRALDIKKTGSMQAKMYKKMSEGVLKFKLNEQTIDWSKEQEQVTLTLESSEITLIEIKNQSESDVFIGDLQFSVTCSLNCKTCDAQKCTECNTGYVAQDGICLLNDCVQKSGQIINAVTTANYEVSEQKVIVDMTMTNIDFTGGCIVPRVYLIQSLDSPTVLYYFSNSDISLQETHLKISLDIENLKDKSQQVNLNNESIQTYYLSLGLFYNNEIKKLWQSVIQVKQVDDKPNAFIQFFEYSEEGEDQDQDIEILQYSNFKDIDNTKKVINIDQTVDPNFQGYTLSYRTGQLDCQGETQNLNLVDYTSKENTNSINFSYEKQIAKFPCTCDFQCQLNQTLKRLLQSTISRDIVNIVYITKTKIENIKPVDSQSEEQDQDEEEGDDDTEIDAGNYFERSSSIGLWIVFALSLVIFLGLQGYIIFKIKPDELDQQQQQQQQQQHQQQQQEQQQQQQQQQPQYKPPEQFVIDNNEIEINDNQQEQQQQDVKNKSPNKSQNKSQNKSPNKSRSDQKEGVVEFDE